MTNVKRNKEQAQAVLDYFEKFPQYHDQGAWFSVDGIGEDYEEVKVKPEKNVCNTTMCVAGNVIFNNYGPFGLHMFEVDEVTASNEAAGLLGISEDEADVLFTEVSDEDALRVVKNISKGEKNIFKGTEYENAL